MNGLPPASDLEAFSGVRKTGEVERGAHDRAVPPPDNQELLAEIVRLEHALSEREDRRREDLHETLLKSLKDRLIRLNQPEDMFVVVTQAVGEHLKVDSCFMDEPGRDGGQWIIHPGFNASAGSLADRRNLFGPHACLTQMLAEGRQVVVNDIRSDPRFLELARDFEQYGVRAFIATPWVNQNRGSGNLTVTMDIPRVWKADELRFLQASAEMSWLFIDHARLYPSLKESEERLYAALNNSPLIVYTNDLSLRCTWIYAGRQEMAGLQVLGKTDEDVLTPNDARAVAALKREVLETGKGIRSEIELMIGDRKCFYDMTIQPLHAANGAITGLTVAASDITELVSLREEKRRLKVYQETQRLITQFREHERLKIAQELHDGPLQEVMAIGFNLAEALEVDEKSQRVEAMLHIRTQLQSVAQELRQFCTDLRPPALAPFGLEKAIRSHMQIFQNSHPGFRFELDLMADGLTLAENIRLGLYRIYQELLTNAVRHSHAHTIIVRLTIDEAQAELEVQDDGYGVDLPTEWLDLARQGRFGLVRMREQAEALGGRLLIQSNQETGTLARVILPLTDNLP